MVSFALVGRVKSSEISYGFDSDHSSIRLSLMAYENKRDYY